MTQSNRTILVTRASLATAESHVGDGCGVFRNCRCASVLLRPDLLQAIVISRLVLVESSSISFSIVLSFSFLSLERPATFQAMLACAGLGCVGLQGHSQATKYRGTARFGGQSAPERVVAIRSASVIRCSR